MPKKNSRRLDVAVAEVASISRERAQALILEGKVTVDGEALTKAGASVAADARIEVRDDNRFASRGGEKLERALEAFEWSVNGLDCLDIGASTGGFTDCLLQRGAASVTAIDVGYGQLAWRLRTDQRVKVIERANFRHIEPGAIGAPFPFACVDVSFISLAMLAGKFREVLSDQGRLVALVKPQFEAGRSAVGKGGVVRKAETHLRAIESVEASFVEAGLAPAHLTYSPITGPAGNIEFLLGAIAGGATSHALDAAGVVSAAHEALAR